MNKLIIVDPAILRRRWVEAVILGACITAALLMLLVMNLYEKAFEERLRSTLLQSGYLQCIQEEGATFPLTLDGQAWVVNCRAKKV